MAFLGSTIAISVIEVAETDSKYNEEIESIKADPSRIDSVNVFIETKAGKIEMSVPNQEIADLYSRQEKIKYFIGILPFTDKISFLNLPDKIALLIGATFMGLLGSIIMLIKESLYNQLVLTPEIILKRSLLGFTSGFLVIVLSYVLPGLITLDSNIDVKIESLTAFSLITGLFFKEILDKLSKNVTKENGHDKRD